MKVIKPRFEGGQVTYIHTLMKENDVTLSDLVQLLVDEEILNLRMLEQLTERVFGHNYVLEEEDWCGP